MIKSIIARKIYEPLYRNFYRRDKTLTYYKLYKKSQWNSLEKNKQIQADKLYNLIKYSSENIPYYINIVKKNKITFSRKTIFNDIKKFPILTKDIIKSEFNSLYKINKKTKWYYNTSGGSTGQPVKFIQDYDYESENEAITRIQYEWCEYNLGDSFIKLWGSDKDIFKEKNKIRHKFANWIKSVHILNSFCMDENKMKEYVTIINKKKPKLILAYTHSIYDLAQFIEANKIKIHSPNAIMTSASTLYPSFRKIIEQTFKCPVFNRYGSREVGSIASECDKHEGLHMNILTQYIEILNKNLQPCKEGETGELYITLLTNFTMPLIRYKIGDMAIYSKKSCSCKRGLPLIKEIIGRDIDVFKTKEGKLIQGEFFIYILGTVYSNGLIDKFQVIQKNYNLLEIKVVVKNKIKFNQNKQDIENTIKKVMENKCKINWTFVNEIKPTKSGKYRYTIREF